MAAKEPTSLYERDFFEWTQHNSELLRRGCFEQADMEHIAEEIADMGSRDQREMRSYLVRIVKHLLKWKFQPDRRSESWRTSIGDSRIELEGIFEQSPSLLHHAMEAFPSIYPKAVTQAEAETGMRKAQFPADCPFRFEQLLDDGFFPD